MSFAYHDPYWTAVLAFVQQHRRPGESVMAPDLFWWGFDRIERYTASFERPPPSPDWAILHKGMLGELGEALVRALPRYWRPLFANEVFVVWGRRDDLPALGEDDAHLRAFHVAVGRTRFGDAPAPEAFSAVLPERHAITQFSSLDERSIAKAMDDFYANGGYRYETRRDRTYYAEIDRTIDEMGGGPDDRRVLDLCCGEGRVLARLDRYRAAVGVDLSGRALATARARFAGDRRTAFLPAAAERLPFADGTFDQAFWIDAIEHVRDPWRTIAELARVLRPGGSLLLTAANRDSLNQRIQRKLGYPAFVTNYQHLREFTSEEVEEWLNAAGFQVVERRGLMLYPYWGLPGMDARLVSLLDEDAELVEILRRLGERAGPDLAYTFVFRCALTGALAEGARAGSAPA